MGYNRWIIYLRHNSSIPQRDDNVVTTAVNNDLSDTKSRKSPEAFCSKLAFTLLTANKDMFSRLFHMHW